MHALHAVCACWAHEAPCMPVRRRLLAYPRGSSTNNQLSLYLNAYELKAPPKAAQAPHARRRRVAICPHVTFDLTLVNQSTRAGAASVTKRCARNAARPATRLFS